MKDFKKVNTQVCPHIDRKKGSRYSKFTSTSNAYCSIGPGTSGVRIGVRIGVEIGVSLTLFPSDAVSVRRCFCLTLFLSDAVSV